MPSRFLCSPMMRECSWKKTQIEKKKVFFLKTKTKEINKTKGNLRIGSMTILPCITAPRTIPPWNYSWEITPSDFNLPDNYPQVMPPWKTTPLTITFLEIPPRRLALNNLHSGQLLKTVSSWVVLSLNFTLIKRVLQLGIIVNPSLKLWPSSTFFRWYCVTKSRNQNGLFLSLV